MSPDEKDSAFTVNDPEPGGKPGSLPRIDFSTFVLSLATSAMVHLGQVPGAQGEAPAEGERNEGDLVLARQTIDTLEMIQEKTRGNLEESESKLLQTVLYELRMAFVAAKG